MTQFEVLKGAEAFTYEGGKVLIESIYVWDLGKEGTNDFTYN